MDGTEEKGQWGAVTLFWVAVVFAIAVLPFSSAAGGQRIGPPGSSVQEQVEWLLLRVPDPMVQSLPERVVAYSERTGTSIEEICGVLMTFVQDGLKLRPGDESSRRARWLYEQSVYLLGELRCAESAPLLRQVAMSDAPDEAAINLRRSAIRAVAQLGGQGLIGFARAVCGDEQRFGGHDRYVLYRHLSAYVGVQGWLTVPEPTSWEEPHRPPVRTDVFRFLLEALSNDPDDGNLMRLDGTLSAASRFYADRGERQAVLERLSRDGIAMHEEYGAKELKALAEVPQDERTRLPENIKAPDELEGVGLTVLKSLEAYAELDRLLLYEALGKQVQRSQGLLVAAALRDPAPDNVIYLDKMLCGASESYRMSREREQALARFEGATLPRWKDYFGKELASLRQTPEAQRTDVAVADVPRQLPWLAIGASGLLAVVAIAGALLLHRARKRRVTDSLQTPAQMG
jgi:hypothetical protein